MVRTTSSLILNKPLSQILLTRCMVGQSVCRSVVGMVDADSSCDTLIFRSSSKLNVKHYRWRDFPLIPSCRPFNGDNLVGIRYRDMYGSIPNMYIVLMAPSSCRWNAHPNSLQSGLAFTQCSMRRCHTIKVKHTPHEYCTLYNAPGPEAPRLHVELFK